MSLSAWLFVAAHTRLKERQRSKPFKSPEDVKGFFKMRDALEGPETEPDWEEHLRAISESRAAGATDT